MVRLLLQETFWRLSLDDLQRGTVSWVVLKAACKYSSLVRNCPALGLRKVLILPDRRRHGRRLGDRLILAATVRLFMQ